jgi:CspA family cold shock protein
MKGIIKRLQSEKGFGFITPEGGAKDVFFHSSSLVEVTFDQLHEGEAVEFDTEDSEKGPRATNVHRV